jgi:hypothetical protein
MHVVSHVSTPEPSLSGTTVTAASSAHARDGVKAVIRNGNLDGPTAKTLRLAPTEDRSRHTAVVRVDLQQP